MGSAQSRLETIVAFRVSPLLDLALGTVVLSNPERFGQPHWTSAARTRLPEAVLARLDQHQVDLFALALELDDQPEPPPVLLARLGSSQPQLADDLLVCWQALAPEFAAVVPALTDCLQTDAERLRTGDAVSFLMNLSDRIAVSGDGDTLLLQWGTGMRVQVADLDRILLVPSAFCPRRLMFYRHLRNLVLFYPPHNRQAAAVSATDAPESIILGFSALADSTRLKLLRLIARHRLPAQEMAQRLNVNESTVSRHLRILMEAGLIGRTSQSGRFIHYSLNHGRFDELIGGLRRYLHEEPSTHLLDGTTWAEEEQVP